MIGSFAHFMIISVTIKKIKKKCRGTENNIALISENVCLMWRTIWEKDSSVSKSPNDSLHTVFLSSSMQYLFLSQTIF